jgi:hypothetical protein
MTPTEPVAPHVAEQINARVDQWKHQTAATRVEILDEAAKKTLDRSASALTRQIKNGFDSLDEYVAVCRYFDLDPVAVLAEAIRRADKEQP